MPTIIKDNAIIESPFTVISMMETTDNPGAIDHVDCLLPMTFYQQQVAALAGRRDLGICRSPRGAGPAFTRDCSALSHLR
jgi:hypothetical protein